MVTPAKTGALVSPKAPNLQIAPTAYASLYQDQFNNALRIYFNQLDSFTQSLVIPSSGNSASRPIANLQVGQFYYDTSLNKPIWWNGTFWKDADGTTQISAALTSTSASGRVGTVV
jgi:hypothetical protein